MDERDDDDEDVERRYATGPTSGAIEKLNVDENKDVVELARLREDKMSPSRSSRMYLDDVVVLAERLLKCRAL
jgi:hypothetical protein